MNKYLLTIEYRYTSKCTYEDGGNVSKSKTVTIGVFDNFDKAIFEGNKFLEVLESKFELNISANGSIAPKQRFSKNGGSFGYPKNLVSNLGYLKTPFSFYAKITTLVFDSVENSIETILNDLKSK